MRGALRFTAFVALLIFVAQGARAQYYSWGADPAALKWSRIKRDSVSVIYPSNVDYTARRMLHYYDGLKPSESFGYKHPGLKVPFIVHPENFASNGMVMWAPLRIEFLSTPAADSYSMPWVKQLVAHEYRHAVQYDNINQSTLKWAYYAFGQQLSAVSLLFPPLYALEGDAVLFETQVSTYGRGLQPSFSIGYRALADELDDRSKYLMWRCGSYRYSVPDHYRMGYFMMSCAYEKYGENVLNKTFEYIARNPQFISPYSLALRKYYDTSTNELFYETFDQLTDFWSEASSVENSSEIISRIEPKNYTTYSSLQLLESGKILAQRSDLSRPSRFVLFDPESSTEEVVAHTGSVSTVGGYAAGRIWWSEYRRSALFAEDINSQICYMDIEQGRPKRLKGFKNCLYPTPIGESKTHIAYVEYDPSGQYTVVELEGGETLSRIAITYPNEVHSLAWDNLTQRLYITVTSDEGMWIEQQTDEGFERLTKPAYITLSDLAAADGVLYFGSIASGKDEVHSLDIATGVERQLTESTYGSFAPEVGGGELYMTTYDKYGYHIARQDAEQSIGEVAYSSTPRPLLNPERTKWPVINLDTVRFDTAALRQSQESDESKKYRKGAHLFNLHSWAPVCFDPLAPLDELSLDISLGATVISQNLLSSCDAFASYGWDKMQGSFLKGGLIYKGLGVELEGGVTYGGHQNVYLIESSAPLKPYADVTLSATLPLYYSTGYHNHSLSLFAGWNYSNGILPHDLSYSYLPNVLTQQTELRLNYSEVRQGLNKLSLGASYTNYVQSAVRDLTTPLGYSLSASYALDPLNNEFSHLLSLYGKIYTPGLAVNNSFTLAAAYQNAIGGFDIEGYRVLSYFSSALIPHGFTVYDISNNNYLALSAAYRLPICYPELAAFWDKLFVKRLSVGVGADYAQYDAVAGGRNSLQSYGVDLIVDLNAISMSPASTLTTTFSLYKPQGRDLYFQFGMGLPF